jgi:hypothetical protein
VVDRRARCRARYCPVASVVVLFLRCCCCYVRYVVVVVVVVVVTCRLRRRTAAELHFQRNQIDVDEIRLLLLLLFCGKLPIRGREREGEREEREMIYTCSSSPD